MPSTRTCGVRVSSSAKKRSAPPTAPGRMTNAGVPWPCSNHRQVTPSIVVVWTGTSRLKRAYRSFRAGVTISRQSPVASRQSPVASYQSPVTSRQLPVSSIRLQLATDYWQLVTGNWLLTTVPSGWSERKPEPDLADALFGLLEVAREAGRLHVV